MSSDYIEMKIPAKPEYLSVIRLSVSGIANRMGFSYDEIEDIKVAVTEACTNSVDHAYPDTKGQIKVTFVVYSDRLEVIVLDNGQSFDIQAEIEEIGPIEANTSIDELSEGGLGLFLIKSLMDKVEIIGQSGVTVTMTKLLNRNGVRGDVRTVQ